MTHPDRPVPAALPETSDADFTYVDAAAHVSTETGFSSTPPVVPMAEEAEIGAPCLGGYRLVETLGEGGMGKVYRAIDDSLNRIVAVKVMRPEIAQSPHALERFLREARAVAAVKSDHIVTVYQVGHENGVPFLAMEYLHGEVLEHRTKDKGQLSVEDIARIGRDVARGLAAAHSRGLIHRDIKPANVWLEPLPEGGFRAKLLDFGLARDTGGDVHITGVGQVVGTPAYMSPEQANGDPVDARTDLFSLGVLLYRLATGRLPFRGDSTLAVLTSLATQDPVPPNRLRPDLPASLSELILQLLSKNRDRRPASAVEVATRLAPAPSQTVVEIERLPDDIQATHFEFDLPADPTETLAVATKAESPTKRSKKARRENRWLLPAICLLSGIVILAGVWKIGAYIVEVKSARGRLIIETDDPTVEVVVKKDGAVIKDRTRDRELDLRVGDYTIEVADNKDGLRLSTGSFTIERDGKAYVRVRLEKPKPSMAVREGPLTLSRVLVTAYDEGPSPLDKLDASKIPASEKFPWQPKEQLVAVIGTHKMRHWGTVSRIVHSPRGDLVASWGSDGVRIWDAKTMTEKGLIRNLWVGENSSLSFSPDGQLLSMYEHGLGTTIYDLTKWPPTQVSIIPGPGLINRWYPFSPGGERMVLHPGAGFTTAEVWDVGLEKPNKVATLTFDAPSPFITMTAKDRVLAVNPTAPPPNNVAVLWNFSGDTTKESARIQLDGSEYAVSPNGKWFVNTTLKDKKVRAYDISGGKFAEKGSFDIEAQAYGLQFVPGESVLLFSDHIRWYLRDLDKGTTRSWLPEQANVGVATAVAPGGTVVVACRTGIGLQAFDLKPDGKAPVLHDSGPVLSVLPAPAANRVMTQEAAPNPPRRWDLDGPEPKPLAIKQAFQAGLTVLPDGRVISRGARLSSLYIHDPGKGDAAVPVELMKVVNEPSVVAATRSGRWLAAASAYMNERSPRLFDFSVTPMKLIGDLQDYPSNQNSVGQLAFAPSEQYLLALGRGDAGAANKTCVWDLRVPKPKHVSTFDHSTSASFAIDTATLVIGYADGKVKLFDYSTGEFKESVAMQPFSRPVAGAILLPGSKTVMASDDQGHIKFLKVPTGEVEGEWKWPGAAVLSLSNDGRHVFTQNANGTGYVLRMKERTPSPLEKLVPAKIPDAEKVDYLPDETVAVFGTHERRTWSGPFGLVGGLAYSPDGKHLVAADFGNLYVYDAASMKLKFRQGAPPFVDSGRAFAFSADGRTLYCSKASTWDLSRDQIKQIIDPTLDKSYGITKATSSDGKLLAFGNHVGESGIIDLSQKNSPIVFKWTVSGHCMEMSFSPDAQWLIAVEKGLGYRVFRLSDGKWSENAVIKAAGSRVTYSFAEKRKLAVLLGGGGPVPVDLSGEKAKELDPFPHFDNVVDFTFDSTGEKWAATRHDYYKTGVAELLLGDWRGKELRETKRIRLPHVGYVAYAPDGKSVATHGHDNSVHVWDLTQDPPVEKFKTDPEVNQISISPDGKTVASVCHDGQLTLSDWPEGLPRRKQSVKTRHSLVYAVWINPTCLLTASLPGLNIPYGPIEITLWDITPEGLKERSAFSTATPSVWQLTVSPDGTRLVHSDTLWDLTATPPTPIGTFKELVKNPDALDFSSDGKHLFASSNGQLLLLDATKPEAPALASAKAPAAVKSLKCSPDGSFVTLHSGAHVLRWERKGKDLVEKLRYTNSSDGKALLGYHLTTAAFNSDGTKSYIGIGNGITECDARTGVALRMWSMPGASYPTISKDGRFLFSSNANGTGYVISLQHPAPGKP